MNHFRQMSIAAAICAVLFPGANVLAYTLWAEDAEDGLAYVIDNTDASYPLIQSEVVAKATVRSTLPILGSRTIPLSSTRRSRFSRTPGFSS